MTARARLASQPEPDGYDAADDVAKSFEEAYRAIRARVAAGGRGWQPKLLDSTSSAVKPARAGDDA
jgi:hypothetical protein